MEAMELREHAEKLFVKLITSESVLDRETQSQLSKSVNKILRDCLAKLETGHRFKYSVFSVIIQKTSVVGKLVPENAARAFESLKLYFVHLYKAPWKKEYRKLKTYCGYFQSMIKAHLEDPETIICLIGFQPDRRGSLILRGEPDRQLCLSLAFECTVAVVECQMLTEFHRRMKESGVNVAGVVRWRDTGELPEPPLKEERFNGIDSGIGASCVGTGSIRSRSVSYGTCNQSKHLPFIDEDDDNDAAAVYTEATLDEHYMASIQRLSQRKRDSDPSKDFLHQRHSDEWGYVTDTLKNKYGSKYFDGERGDVTRPPHPNVPVVPDDVSDEGIDVAEEPPPVDMSNLHLRTQMMGNVYAPSDRTHARESSSGYRTQSSARPSTRPSATPVFYPPRNTLPLGQPSPSPSFDTSAYVSQTPFFNSKSPLPAVTRGRPHNFSYVSINSAPRKPHAVEADGISRHQMYTSHTPRVSNNVALADPSPNRGEEWACANCTLVNEKSSNICSGCGRSRNRPENDGPQCGESITVCSKCTYENTAGAEECAMCNTPLEKNVHTYV